MATRSLLRGPALRTQLIRQAIQRPSFQIPSPALRNRCFSSTPQRRTASAGDLWAGVVRSSLEPGSGGDTTPDGSKTEESQFVEREDSGETAPVTTDVVDESVEAGTKDTIEHKNEEATVHENATATVSEGPATAETSKPDIGTGQHETTGDSIPKSGTFVNFKKKRFRNIEEGIVQEKGSAAKDDPAEKPPAIYKTYSEAFNTVSLMQRIKENQEALRVAEPENTVLVWGGKDLSKFEVSHVEAIGRTVDYHADQIRQRQTEYNAIIMPDAPRIGRHFDSRVIERRSGVTLKIKKGPRIRKHVVAGDPLLEKSPRKVIYVGSQNEPSISRVISDKPGMLAASPERPDMKLMWGGSATFTGAPLSGTSMYGQENGSQLPAVSRLTANSGKMDDDHNAAPLTESSDRVEAGSAGRVLDALVSAILSTPVGEKIQIKRGDGMIEVDRPQAIEAFSHTLDNRLGATMNNINRFMRNNAQSFMPLSWDTADARAQERDLDVGILESIRSQLQEPRIMRNIRHLRESKPGELVLQELRNGRDLAIYNMDQVEAIAVLASDLRKVLLDRYSEFSHILSPHIITSKFRTLYSHHAGADIKLGLKHVNGFMFNIDFSPPASDPHTFITELLVLRHKKLRDYDILANDRRKKYTKQRPRVPYDSYTPIRRTYLPPDPTWVRRADFSTSASQQYSSSTSLVDVPKPRLEDLPPHFKVGLNFRKVLEKREKRTKQNAARAIGLIKDLSSQIESESLELNTEKDQSNDTALSDGEFVYSEFESNDLDELTKFGTMSLGDVVELRGSKKITLGMYLRPTEGSHSSCDILTEQGTVVPILTHRIPFVIPSFFPAAQAKSMLEYFERVMIGFKQTGEQDPYPLLDKTITGSTVKELRDLFRKAMVSYEGSVKLFEELYHTLALEGESKRITTREVCEIIFGDRPSTAELYATHYALISDTIRFRGDKGHHRVTGLWKVLGKSEVRVIDVVTEWLRQADVTIMKKGGTGRGKNSSMKRGLRDFVVKARVVIDRSRELRRKSLENPNERVFEERLPKIKWTEDEKLIIKYIRSRMQTWGLQRTPIEGLVPLILKMTERYENSTSLDANAVYEFLIDIGAYGGWEVTALHNDNLRLPKLGISAEADAEQTRYDLLEGKSLSDLGLEDCLSHMRVDLGDLPVYVVDDVGAQEIDDGVSIEKLKGDDLRLHVHIADPSSYLPTDHWISEAVQKRISTKYFKPSISPMLPEPIAMGLSLQRGAPALTISMTVDGIGNIKDWDIRPTIINNVQSVSYARYNKLLGIEIPKPVTMELGQIPPPLPDGSEIELSKKKEEDLKLLCTLATRSLKQRVKDGMLYVSYPFATTEFYDDKAGTSLQNLAEPTLYGGFPPVRITITHAELEPPMTATRIISEFMSLACNIAAKYFIKHDIPAPFRAWVYTAKNEDLVKEYERTVLGARDEYGRAPHKLLTRFLMSGVHVAANNTTVVPRPHAVLGFSDGYVRFTSPLRRLSDMLAHWNLQAFWLKKPYPFTKTMLTEDLIPRMLVEEKTVKYGSKEVVRYWITAFIKRCMELGRMDLLPNNGVLRMQLLEIVPELAATSSGMVEELSTMGKVRFSDANLFTKLKRFDIIKVRPVACRLGERMVEYEFMGIDKSAE